MAGPERAEQDDLVGRVLSNAPGGGSRTEELAAPPPGLFDRIEDAASVPVVAAPVVVEYSIDRDDCLVSTGGDWDRFAAENDGGELAEEPPRLSLWSQIEGSDARRVWQLVVSEVRRTNSEAKVPFRCDAPGLRRWYQISVTPGEDGSVDFRSELLFEERRPDLDLIARGSDRDSTLEPIEVCCWCARGRDGDRWISLDELVLGRRALENEPMPPVEQGICSDCASSMATEADRLTTT